MPTKSQADTRSKPVKLGSTSVTPQDAGAHSGSRDSVENSDSSPTIDSIPEQVQQLANEVAILQNMLLQRREENEQVWKQLEAERGTGSEVLEENARLRSEIARVSEKFAESEAWVFRLAGERTATENLVKASNSALGRAQREARENIVRLAQLEQELDAARARIRALHEEASDARNRSAPSPRTPDTRSIPVGSAPSESENDARLLQRFAEINALTQMLREQERIAGRESANREWSQKVYAVLSSCPRWWAIMTKGWQLSQQHGRLKRKGLFDGDAYLAHYPDVAAAGTDPLWHYMLHGMSEGRSRLF